MRNGFQIIFYWLTLLLIATLWCVQNNIIPVFLYIFSFLGLLVWYAVVSSKGVDKEVLDIISELGDNATIISIHEKMEERSGKSESLSRIYHACERLEDKGHIGSYKKQVPERKSPMKFFYPKRNAL